MSSPSTAVVWLKATVGCSDWVRSAALRAPLEKVCRRTLSLTPCKTYVYHNTLKEYHGYRLVIPNLVAELTFGPQAGGRLCYSEIPVPSPRSYARTILFSDRSCTRTPQFSKSQAKPSNLSSPR